MKESARTEGQGRTTKDRAPHQSAPRSGVPDWSAGPSAANALALQRAVGNRAAARVLARWSKHPDEKEKGKLLSDDAAADYLHFNVPLSK